MYRAKRFHDHGCIKRSSFTRCFFLLNENENYKMGYNMDYKMGLTRNQSANTNLRDIENITREDIARDTVSVILLKFRATIFSFNDSLDCKRTQTVSFYSFVH